MGETAPHWLIKYSGIPGGSARAAAASMPRQAILALINAAQERGCCIAVVLADFCAKHHEGVA